MSITKNEKLKILEQSVDNVNTDIMNNNVDKGLSDINYNDNQIKMNNELLQIVANRYNKDSVEFADLKEDIMKSNELIRKNKRKLRIKQALINYAQLVILGLFLFGIPFILLFSGKISQNGFLYLMGGALLVFILYLRFRKKPDLDLEYKDNHLYHAGKINNFRFENGALNGGGDEADSNFYSSVNEELIKKCCGEKEEEIELTDDMIKDNNKFFYDKTLPIDIYL